VMLLRSL